jgi:hypothetical protein
MRELHKPEAMGLFPRYYVALTVKTSPLALKSHPSQILVCILKLILSNYDVCTQHSKRKQLLNSNPLLHLHAYVHIS